jgi:hypothetical protein
MAAQTIDAVVHVVANAAVIVVGLDLGMTIGAGEHRIVVRVGVAGAANAVRPAMAC